MEVPHLGWALRWGSRGGTFGVPRGCERGAAPFPFPTGGGSAPPGDVRPPRPGSGRHRGGTVVAPRSPSHPTSVGSRVPSAAGHSREVSQSADRGRAAKAASAGKRNAVGARRESAVRDPAEPVGLWGGTALRSSAPPPHPPTPRPQGPPGPVPPRGAPAVPTSFVPRSEFRPAAPTCGSAGTGAAKSPFRERSSALECREPRDGHQNRHRRRRGREGGSAAGRGPVASHPFRFSFFSAPPKSPFVLRSNRRFRSPRAPINASELSDTERRVSLFSRSP